MRTSGLMTALLLGASFAPGCTPRTAGTDGGARSLTTVTPSVLSDAQRVFAARCAPCHGAEGRGDGPAAVTPRPRNFHDAAWQAVVTDAQIETVIREGGAAVGKSPVMPPNPDLGDRPEAVAALRMIIRGMR